MASPSHDTKNSSPTDKSRGLGFSTLSVHAGESRQKPAHSLTDPIVCASTYSFANSQAIIDYIQQKQQRGEYGKRTRARLHHHRQRRLCQWHNPKLFADLENRLLQLPT